jgi:hypothetical protein
MKKFFESDCTARLHVQPVLYACKKAILHFGESRADFDFQRFYLNALNSHTIYSWIDNDLLNGAFTIVFHFLFKNIDPDSSVYLNIGKTGNNTCQILISSEYPELSNECEGPLTLSSAGLHITDIESLQYIMEMHGGCIQLWRHRTTLNYIFEINFLCVCKNGEFQ